MKTFTQSFTRSTNNATQQMLSLIYAALSFTREVPSNELQAVFLFPAIMLLLESIQYI